MIIEMASAIIAAFTITLPLTLRAEEDPVQDVNNAPLLPTNYTATSRLIELPTLWIAYPAASCALLVNGIFQSF